MTSTDRIEASYRDPSGFVFRRNGELLRQINQCYKDDYAALTESGLYRALVEQGQLVQHDEVGAPFEEPRAAWKLIRPRKIDFISYPYEWSFSQLKDAALLTLAIQREAMQRDLSL